MGLPWWFRWWGICLQCRRSGLNPWIRKIPWRRKWQATPVILDWRSLVAYSLWGHKESDTTEWLSLHFNQTVSLLRTEITTFSFVWLDRGSANMSECFQLDVIALSVYSVLCSEGQRWRRLELHFPEFLSSCCSPLQSPSEKNLHIILANYEREAEEPAWASSTLV